MHDTTNCKVEYCFDMLPHGISKGVTATKALGFRTVRLLLDHIHDVSEQHLTKIMMAKWAVGICAKAYVYPRRAAQ